MPIITAFDKDGLRLTFALEKIPDSNTITINVAAFNSTLSNMTDFLFQAAVPKASKKGNYFFFFQLSSVKIIFMILIFSDIPIASVVTFWYSDAPWWTNNSNFASDKP